MHIDSMWVCTCVYVVLVYIGAWMNVWMSWYGCGQWWTGEVCTVAIIL